MKIVMIVYNEAMDDEVMETLKNCALNSYTKICGVFGKGRASGTHMGDDIWPGKNNVLYIACSDDDSAKLLRCVSGLRNQLGKEGVKAFSWGLDQVT